MPLGKVIKYINKNSITLITLVTKTKTNYYAYTMNIYFCLYQLYYLSLKHNYFNGSKNYFQTCIPS